MEPIQILLLLWVCLLVCVAALSAGKLLNHLQWFLYRDMEWCRPMTLGALCESIGELVVSCTLIFVCHRYENVLIGVANGS